MKNNKKIKLLYVDDEYVNRFIFEKTVDLSNDFTSLIAEDGESALDLIRKNNDINVIISDMSMPKMNGIEFIRNAKKILPNAKYFILSGYLINDEINNALKQGLILNYLQKPFDLNRLKEFIN